MMDKVCKVILYCLSREQLSLILTRGAIRAQTNYTYFPKAQ